MPGLAGRWEQVWPARGQESEGFGPGVSRLGTRAFQEREGTGGVGRLDEEGFGESGVVWGGQDSGQGVSS